MSPARLPVWVLALLFLTGCSNYQLGSGSQKIHRIEILPVRNSAAIPGIHGVLQQALVTTLNTDKRIRLESGDETLEVEVTGYTRKAVTRSTSDALVAGQFRISLAVVCTLSSKDKQKVRFARRTFTASAILAAAGDLSAEERQILPRLATEIATQIRDASVGSW